MKEILYSFHFKKYVRGEGGGVIKTDVSHFPNLNYI